MSAHGRSKALTPERDQRVGCLVTALPDNRASPPMSLTVRDVPDQRPWLWVQDSAALRLTGRPYRPGLPRALRHRLIHVATKTPEDALFALEEGLRCRDLVFVLGEVAGNPRALSFTASRRLSLLAERHGTPLWLVRIDAAQDLSSARQRWQVRAAPSLPPRWNAHAPGLPAWQADLFRARSHPPGQWRIAPGEGSILPFRGGGPAKLVEGHRQVIPSFRRQDQSPVPLHHPADGPPPRAGKELRA